MTKATVRYHHNSRQNRIHHNLTDLQERGIIRSYQSQTGMPGYRWTVEMPGKTRVFTTARVESFIDGANAVIGRHF